MWESGCAYGSILWLLFLDEHSDPFDEKAMNMGNVDVMSVLLWVPFWMDRNFAMNECGCYGWYFMGTLLDGQKFCNE
jgi:hypothetical protein